MGADRGTHQAMTTRQRTRRAIRTRLARTPQPAVTLTRRRLPAEVARRSEWSRGATAGSESKRRRDHHLRPNPLRPNRVGVRPGPASCSEFEQLRTRPRDFTRGRGLRVEVAVGSQFVSQASRKIAVGTRCSAQKGVRSAATFQTTPPVTRTSVSVIPGVEGIDPAGGGTSTNA